MLLLDHGLLALFLLLDLLLGRLQSCRGLLFELLLDDVAHHVVGERGRLVLGTAPSRVVLCAL